MAARHNGLHVLHRLQREDAAFSPTQSQPGHRDLADRWSEIHLILYDLLPLRAPYKVPWVWEDQRYRGWQGYWRWLNS